MPKSKKVGPVSDSHYKGMIFTYKLMDLFGKPEKRLNDIPIKKGQQVVDYACGPGRYSIPLAKRIGPKGKVYAVDIQPLAIQIVKEKAARAGLKNIEAIRVDSYDTGIKAGSIDLVMLLDAFHSISDRPALLKEIKRILKPDGRFFMEPGHMKPKKAREIVESTGLFKIIESKGNDLLLAPVK